MSLWQKIKNWFEFQRWAQESFAARAKKENEDRAKYYQHISKYGQSHFLGVRIRKPVPGDRDWVDPSFATEDLFHLNERCQQELSARETEWPEMIE